VQHSNRPEQVQQTTALLDHLVGAGDRLTERDLGELLARAIEKRIGIDRHYACPELEHARKGCVQLAVAAGMHDMQRETEIAGEPLYCHGLRGQL
jgi:hypothetical protein